MDIATFSRFFKFFATFFKNILFFESSDFATFLNVVRKTVTVTKKNSGEYETKIMLDHG